MSALLDPIRRLMPSAWKQPLKRRLGLPETRLHPDWSFLEPIGPYRSPHTILDIGAHSGWFFHCWLDWCPEARVHAFEPYPASYQRACELYGQDPRVTIHPIGVGAKPGRLPFHVLSESRVSNSFLPPEQQTWDRVAYQTGSIDTIEAPLTTVDLFCNEQAIGDIYLMKIDVQGFEMEVLQGCAETLGRVDHILVESGLQQLYTNAPRVSDVFNHLTARGFHLMAQRSWHRGNHVLMESDMLFRRDGLEGPIDPSISRVVVSG
ncbi:MAG: FkbM family methyltransferase [Synechococcaceae cyanobacterium]|nr:FkbM family methyltransferase [Synechococcaceae cyanobacterium]